VAPAGSRAGSRAVLRAELTAELTAVLGDVAAGQQPELGGQGVAGDRVPVCLQDRSPAPVPHSPVRFAARNTKPLGTVLLKRKQPWLRWGYLTPGVSWRGPDQCQDTSWTGSPRSAALRAKAPSKVQTAVPSRRARHTYVESVACRRRNRAVIAATS
jgi:hypothetical protein